jgi:hypothetical protein
MYFYLIGWERIVDVTVPVVMTEQEFNDSDSEDFLRVIVAGSLEEAIEQAKSL